MKAVYSNNLFDDNPEVTHMQVIHQSMPDMQMFDAGNGSTNHIPY